jgi:DNA-directed RNA polymerase alpha subunit
MKNIHQLLSEALDGDPTARQEYEDRLDTSLCDLDLSVRTCNALENSKYNVIVVRSLLNLSVQDLLAINNLAERTVLEIMQKLWDHGMCKIGSNRPTAVTKDGAVLTKRRRVQSAHQSEYCSQ